MVREHYTLYKPALIDILKSLHLTKCEITSINDLIISVEDELQNDGEGVKIDGTKTLSCYRHLIDLVTEVTTNKYDTIGEENNPYRIMEIENELTHKIKALITYNKYIY